jgi:hypothetical protein
MNYQYEKHFIKDMNTAGDPEWSADMIVTLNNSRVATSIEGNERFQRGFVSLGKLIQNLVALPIVTKNLYTEVQTIYYPANHESAGARKHTTASLPISVDRLYEEFKKHVKEGSQFTPDSIFKILANMLQDRNSFCYALWRENDSIEKELEEDYGYKFKDNVISLNEDGQRAAYAEFRSNWIENKKDSRSFPTLKQITGNDISAQEENIAANSGDEDNTENVDPRNYEQPMYNSYISNFRKKNISSTIADLYKNDGITGPEDATSFKMINLKKDIEPCQVLWRGADNILKSLYSLSDIGAPYDKDATILRLHIYDAHLSPRNGLSFVSEKVTSGDSYLKIQSTIDPAHLSKLQGKNLIDKKTGKAYNGMYDKNSGKALIHSKAGNMIINMPPWLLKKYLKREYPSITYGAVSSIVKSINLSSTTENEIMWGKAVQSMQDQEDGVYSKYIIQEKMDLNIIPSTIDLQILGCPFLKVCGHIYVDTGTNTDMDNVYSIVSFSQTYSLL